VDPRLLSLEPFGDAALRVRLPPGETPGDLRPRLLAALRAQPGVIDAVVTEQHALVTFNPGEPPAGLEAVLAAALTATEPPPPPREHVIPVRYDGPDLQEIAHHIGCTAREVVYLHVGVPYAVVAVGFLPGFAYLRGLDPRLFVPRRSTPRTRVPANAVAIAGPYTGVYPSASPGGWNLVGTAIDFAAFDPARGARLAVGDRVTFVESGR
jgi:UPF0271 protein